MSELHGNIEAMLAAHKTFDSAEPDAGSRIAAGKFVCGFPRLRF